MQQVRKLGNAFMYFSDRNDGISKAPYDSLNIGSHVGDDSAAVQKNREILQSFINEQQPIVDNSKWVFTSQTHEPNIFFADKNIYDSLNPPVADASITQSRDQPLVVMTADCGPLVIAGENILAVVHASWKTVSSGIMEKTVNEIKKRSPGQDLYSFLGPCIYPHTYEFDSGLLNELGQKLGDHVKAKTNEGKPAFNLPLAIQHQCKELGLGFDEIGINTFDSPNHYSYRRDNTTGRQGVVAWLK